MKGAADSKKFLRSSREELNEYMSPAKHDFEEIRSTQSAQRFSIHKKKNECTRDSVRITGSSSLGKLKQSECQKKSYGPKECNQVPWDEYVSAS